MLWNTKFLNNFFLYIEPLVMTLNFKKIVTIIISALYISIINYLYKYIYYTKCIIANVTIFSTVPRNVKIKYKFLFVNKWNYNNSMDFIFGKSIWFGIDWLKKKLLFRISELMCLSTNKIVLFTITILNVIIALSLNLISHTVS